jgi:hypothetical protein
MAMPPTDPQTFGSGFGYRYGAGQSEKHSDGLFALRLWVFVWDLSGHFARATCHIAGGRWSVIATVLLHHASNTFADFGGKLV